MRSEHRPRTAGQRRHDDGEFMRERVSTMRLPEHSDQQHRNTSAGEQDPANTSCGLQSERGEQIAEAHTGES